jgi:4-hydroxy-tetrahydrodipicolinate synthase
MLKFDDVRGVVVPAATPLTEDEQVDETAMAKLVSHMIEGGVHGLFLLGTTGEFARLDDVQKRKAGEAAVEAIGGRVPVYIGVSDAGARKVKQNIRMAEQLKADVIVCTLPYYIPVRHPREQLHFFETVLGETDLPVMLYNIPATVNAEISLEVVEKASRKPNMIGIKDSSGNLGYLKKLVEMRPKPEYKVLVGDESLSAKGLLSGGDGLVPSLANVFPKLFVDLYKRCAAGDEEGAMRLQSRIDEINQWNKCSDSWLGALIFRKKALSMMGIGSERLAEPYLRPDSEMAKRMEIAIGQFLAEKVNL